ncbi:MAG: response regulator [Deltaproteobacteria bacterium]|nr:response regulator [Deltaproteobacteria bacterium]
MVGVEHALLLVDPYKNLLSAYRLLFEQAGLALETAASLREARTPLAQKDYPLILAELDMPGEESLHFWKEIKTKAPESYLILLTDTVVDEEKYERIFDAGVDDLILKPFSPAKLLVQVRRGLRQRLSTRQADKKYVLPLLDPVSGSLERIIYNGDYFKRRFRQELKRARRHRDPLSLLLIKISGEGREEKDYFLRELAELIRRLIREDDVIGRENGGFGILLYKTDQNGSKRMKIRLAQTIRNHRPFREDSFHFLIKSLKIQMYTIPDQKKIPRKFSTIVGDIDREISSIMISHLVNSN